MANFILTQNVQVTKELSSLTSDSTIYKTPTGCKWGSGTQLYAGEIVGVYFRTFSEWDISSLKHVYSIDDLWVVIHYYSDHDESDIIGIRDGQPSNGSSSTDIWNWIESGTTYIHHTTNWGSNKGNFVFDLGSSARTHLLSDISGSKDFFAIGTRITYESSPTDANLVFLSSSSTFAEPSPQRLYVKYTINNVVSLLQPKGLTRHNSRNIEHHKFKSGNFANRDIGSKGRVIRMNGTLSDIGSETSLANIDDMMDEGQPITISGFADATLNSIWLIEDFIWDKKEGYDKGTTADIYDWELTLRKLSG